MPVPPLRFDELETAKAFHLSPQAFDALTVEERAEMIAHEHHVRMRSAYQMELSGKKKDDAQRGAKSDRQNIMDRFFGK